MRHIKIWYPYKYTFPFKKIFFSKKHVIGMVNFNGDVKYEKQQKF